MASPEAGVAAWLANAVTVISQGYWLSPVGRSDAAVAVPATVSVVTGLGGAPPVSEDERQREDEHGDSAADSGGWFERNLGETWVMVSPGIYRLRHDMPPENDARVDVGDALPHKM